MGFFSWYTQDTNRPIPNIHQDVLPVFTVHMIDPRNGNMWIEEAYDGYGVFAGKDFYQLLAEMNGLTTREEGIELAFSGKDYASPLLVEFLDDWEQYKGEKPKEDPQQGFFYERELVERYDCDGDDVVVCNGCGDELTYPRYEHINRAGEREWLCPDCAAILLGESINSSSFEFRRR